ncbi:aminotransferase class V-fold PLP-dependent enzyme [Deminuibacter soli]|uniref:Probable cysteine desulfurase n=1 Tax=Deminuibacter soli TaxID=2291815 RepID=A0A3E1NIA9_9BACT|nr:SufS family cysteine desulfurase [Deminuibacter soli]RFM27611.1 SufS family cysteine desulfurase [Deminuibacter soli]
MSAISTSTPSVSVESIRADFPILNETINGHHLVYFDNAATSQKPMQVMEAMNRYYFHSNSNVHRGAHTLSVRATDCYEGARDTVARLLNAASSREIVFTGGTTDSINLVAYSFSNGLLKAGDEILVSTLEHHSNIIPWQLAAQRCGATVKAIPMDAQGNLLINSYRELLSSNTRLVAVTHVSNTLGTINPVRDIIAIAHEKGIPVLIDAAQSVPHFQIDVQDLDADFVAFSGHKMLGPTGIGVLYAKESWLNQMPPFRGGGGMIQTGSVTIGNTLYNKAPYKFEAGTPNVAGAVGLAAAIDYMNEVGYDFIQQQEEQLLHYALEQLQQLPEVQLAARPEHMASVFSFNVKNAHYSDVATLLDSQGVAVRSGMHCTEPLLSHLQVNGTARVSFAFYNTLEEVDVFIKALQKAIRMLS